MAVCTMLQRKTPRPENFSVSGHVEKAEKRACLIQGEMQRVPSRLNVIQSCFTLIVLVGLQK